MIRHLLPLIIGVLVAVISAILVPLAGMGERLDLQIVLTVTSVSIVLLAERWFTQDKISEMIAIFQEDLRAVPQFTTGGLAFSDEEAAFEYLVVNAAVATEVSNTRFMDPATTHYQGGTEYVLGALDQVILRQVKRGMSYRFVCDTTAAAYARSFCKAVEGHKGLKFSVRIGEFSRTFALQLTILHYEKRQSEVMVGWTYAGEKRGDEQVLLFRNPEAVSYFEKLFVRYQQVSKPFHADCSADA
ncbi:MAG TPA: hypothetical protein VF650_08565 [Allosphingosinicella sp.]|jgi:hypothetical protein